MSLPAVALSVPGSPLLTAPTRKHNLVTQVALRSLKELIATLVCALTVISFIPSPSGIGVIVTALFIQMGVSLFFHMLSVYASSQEGKGSHGRAPSFCDWVTGANFALFTGYNTQTLVHETGHALAAMAVYKNPRPQITVQPFLGGLTQFYKTTLSPFGKKIGSVGTTCLVVASGPALTLLLSSALLLIGLAMKEKHPQFGKYLISWSLLDFLNHAHYAHSAHWANPSDLTHDFVHLSIFGLTPVMATVGIIAIPTLLALGSYIGTKNQTVSES